MRLKILETHITLLLVIMRLSGTKQITMLLNEFAFKIKKNSFATYFLIGQNKYLV